MATANTWSQGLLDLIFENTDFTGLGDAGGLRGSAVAGSIYISLYTSDPGAGGSQNTNEANYGSYARVAVARTAAQWTRTSQTTTNDNAITFPTCSSGSNSITHFGIGTDSAGAGKLMYSGALTVSPKVVSAGDTPSFAASALTVSQS